jgi:type VI secretion system protein VasD
MLHTVMRFAGLLGLLAGVSACAPPPPPPPTVVNLTLKGAADVNPTESGVAAPVQLRVYQLTSTAAFNGAEFFALLDRDAATLGDQLVRREDFLLAPNETRTSTLNPEARVTALGVFIGARSIDGVTWRGTWAVPPNKTSAITVTAARAGVTLAPAP